MERLINLLANASVKLVRWLQLLAFYRLNWRMLRGSLRLLLLPWPSELVLKVTRIFAYLFGSKSCDCGCQSYKTDTSAKTVFNLFPVQWRYSAYALLLTSDKYS